MAPKSQKNDTKNSAKPGKNKPWKKKIPKERDQTPSNLIEFDYQPPAQMFLANLVDFYLCRGRDLGDRIVL
jgi:hypothetical protein